MRPRSRLLRVAKWGGAVACVLLIAIYVASAWWYVTGWSAERYYRTFSIGSGAVEVGWWNNRWVGQFLGHGFSLPQDQPGSAMGAWGFSRHRAHMIWTPAVTRESLSRSPGIGTTIRIPLWILLLITAIPTVVFWRLDRRRPLPGHCPCGYNLIGNVSGTCPECGWQAASETGK